MGMNDQRQIPATQIEEAPYKHGAKKDAVLAYLKEHPGSTNASIARALGIRAGYVSIIRQRASLSKTRGPRIVMDFRHRQDLYDWLQNNCPSDISAGEYAMSMLAEIMVDDLETENSNA